jgi:glycine/D-amino acid oxidase-like deaminating enzyme
MHLPEHSPYVIAGAGIHGLSTAYHLALELQAKGTGDGTDIVVLDKTGICAGATGIACGVIRNNYYQPAMRELMAHSVRAWEKDPETYSYHAVGYMQISCESMHDDVASISEQQKEIGYESTFIEGEKACCDYMRGLFSDWRAKGITSVLHEKPGGYANNRRAIEGLARKAGALGVRILGGVEVTEFIDDSEGAITALGTSRGHIACDYVVIAPGPWARSFWQMLQLPESVDVTNPSNRDEVARMPMWTYWSLQEGTLGIDPGIQVTNDGRAAPVIHVDTDAYKPDLHFDGIQGGAAPFMVDKPAEEVAVDPYGPKSSEFIVGDGFAHMWVSALAHCQERFSGRFADYKREPSGGIGAFTPDSFPVFDTFRENCYLIADSNHGYKMLGVGELVAKEICTGQASALLEPFRFSRYAAGRLHPVSNSPFPWS